MVEFNLSTFDPYFVGFDRMFDTLDKIQSRPNNVSSYPPYNIKKIDDNKYQLEMALAGFTKTDLDVEVKDNTLTVTGNSADDTENTNSFVYKGIAQRAFTRQWTLMNYLKVFSANFKDGVLVVDMELNEPEEEKGKKIEVK